MNKKEQQQKTLSSSTSAFSFYNRVNKPNDNSYYELNPTFSLKRKQWDKDSTGLRRVINSEDIDRPDNIDRSYFKKGPQVYIESPAETTYKKFMKEITDKETKEFNPPKDEDGRKTQLPFNKPNAGYIIHNIIRWRINNGVSYDSGGSNDITTKGEQGDEYLVTKGLMYGHNKMGETIFRWSRYPELYERTIFKSQRDYDPKNKEFVKIMEGSTSVREVFLLPFSNENLDMLFEHTLGFNNWFPHNIFPNSTYNFRSGNEISLYVKKEGFTGGITVGGQGIFNPQETVKLFKEKSFNDLFNGTYYPDWFFKNRDPNNPRPRTVV